MVGRGASLRVVVAPLGQSLGKVQRLTVPVVVGPPVQHAAQGLIPGLELHRVHMIVQRNFHNALPPEVRINLHRDFGEIQGVFRRGIIGLPGQVLDIGLVPLEVADTQHQFFPIPLERLGQLPADGIGPSGGDDGGHLLLGAPVGEVQVGLIAGHHRGQLILDVFYAVGS